MSDAANDAWARAAALAEKYSEKEAWDRIARLAEKYGDEPILRDCDPADDINLSRDAASDPKLCDMLGVAIYSI